LGLILKTDGAHDSAPKVDGAALMKAFALLGLEHERHQTLYRQAAQMSSPYNSFKFIQ
jgi:hypothetical protein